MRSASSRFADRRVLLRPPELVSWIGRALLVGLVSAGGLVPAALSAGVFAARASAAVEDPSVPPAPPGTRLVLAAAGIPSPLEELERSGFRVAVAIPPRLFYVVETRNLHLLPAGFAWSGPATAALPSGAAPLAGTAGVPDSSAAAPGSGAGGAFPPQSPFGGRIDALPPLRPPSHRAPSAAPGLAGDQPGLYMNTQWGETSEFLVGRVAVGILFAESDGTLDPNHYDWTPALRDSLVEAAVKGLARWAVRAGGKGIPLTFVLEIRPSLATRYEPIDRPVTEEALWIADVLGPLAGYSGDAAGEAYEYANALRARLGTQWCFLLLGVQDDTDPDGTFPDGYIAHSRLGGPWIVMPIQEPAGALDYYIEHETAHMFWALDEYPAFGPGGGWWSCTLTTGYFAFPNTNSSIPWPGYCCLGCHFYCIMDGNYPGQVCTYTEGQVGWADKDNSGKLDLFETRAAVLPDSGLYQAFVGQTKTVKGLALEDAIRNLNPYLSGAGDSISVARVDSVQMRVDGGPWATLPPQDGRYDTGRERFAAIVGPLAEGTHVVEWQAWNSNGLATTPTSFALLEVIPSTLAGGVGGDGAAPAASLRAGPNPGRGPFTFTLIARPGARGVARLHDAAGRLVWSAPFEVPGSGRMERAVRATSRGGAPAASGLYFLSVDVGGTRLTRRLVLLR